jgi:hypothetical protein
MYLVYHRSGRNSFFTPWNAPFRIMRGTLNIVTCMSDSQQGFGLDIKFIDHLQVVTTNNYNTVTISAFKCSV